MKKLTDRPPHGSGSGIRCKCDACRENAREASRRYRESHLEELRAKAAARQRAYRERNPEKVRAANRATHRKHGRKYALKQKHGLTPVELGLMVMRQGGRCAICRSDFGTWKNTHIDHDHVTGTKRGLLCSSCNLGIGMFKDSTERLRAAAAYLANHSTG